MALREVLQSRVVLVLGTVVAVAVPLATVPQLPHVSPWPVLAGLVPWVFGKYVLCPMRWRTVTIPLSGAPSRHGWYLRAHAEAEVFGLLTPGHVGADLWRIKRLSQSGLSRADAVLSAAMDRIVGAVVLVGILLVAAPTLPVRMLVMVIAVSTVAAVGALVARRLRPRLLPRTPLPPPRALAYGLVLSAAYQLTIVGMLLGTVHATGHGLSPVAVLVAFVSSQAAAAVPGPNGASPRDGALVVALVALGMPWLAATAAVTLKATLAWLPALTLGGISLLLLRRQSQRSGPPGKVPAPAF